MSVVVRPWDQEEEEEGPKLQWRTRRRRRLLGRSVGSGKGSEWDFHFLPSEEEEEEGRDYETEAKKVYREEQKSTHQNEAFFPFKAVFMEKRIFFGFFCAKAPHYFFSGGEESQSEQKWGKGREKMGYP